MKKQRMLKVMFALLIVGLLVGEYNNASAASKQKKELTLATTKMTLMEGNTKTLKVKKNTTGVKKVTYKSSNTKVATVTNKGLIKAKKKGLATITVKAGSKVAKCEITVKSRVIEVRELAFEEYNGRVIDQQKSYDNPVHIYPSNATDKKLTFTSSDTSIVTVDKNTGAITGHKEGDAYITVKASNGVSAVCEIYVTGDIYEEWKPEKHPEEQDSTLYVKQGTVSLGQTIPQLTSTLGVANRIDDNEYGGKTYVYNSDYSSLVFVYVKNDLVVGYYTNAASFRCAGISNLSTSNDVHEVSLGSDVWTVPDKYTTSVWYDSYGTGRPFGIILMEYGIRIHDDTEEYLLNASPTLIYNMEMAFLDLVNGFRGREGIAPVRLDPKLADVARAHCLDMSVRGYADHNTPEGITPWQRASNAGIGYSKLTEIAGAAALSNAPTEFTGFMLSPGHRDAVLNPSYVYAGPGIVYRENKISYGYNVVMFYY